MGTPSKLKVGVIGRGAWGQRLMATLQGKTKHCEQVWSAGADWRQAQPARPDFIVIATPYATHAKLMEQCFERAIPFIVEKPAANYYELKKLAEKYMGRITPWLVNHTLLFNPAIEAMVQFAHKGSDNFTAVKLRGEHGGPGPVRGDCSSLLDYGSHGVALGLWLSEAKTARALRLHVGKRNETSPSVNTGQFSMRKTSEQDLYGAQNFVLHARFEHLEFSLRVGNNYPKKRLLYTTEYNAGTLSFTHRFREFPERELLAYVESDLWEVEYAKDVEPLTNALDSFARVVKGERAMDARFGWELPMRTMQVLATCDEMLRAAEYEPDGALN